MLKIGFIVNPVAGIGGKVGLKGSDGEQIIKLALSLGAQPESSNKAKAALEQLEIIKRQIEIYTYPNEMGEDVATSCGFSTSVFGQIISGATKPVDTKKAAREFLDAGADIILFAGGDGTARNILDAVGDAVPVLGIPTGCKIHSAVYALNPRRAGELIIKICEGKIKQYREAEVMDIDEELFRQDRVQAKLYGYLKVPVEKNLVQTMKSGRSKSEDAEVSQMAGYIAHSMERDKLYIIGPGSTTRAIMDELNLKNTLLGVDLVCNKKVIANDAAEKDIIEKLDTYSKAEIIVTIIGGQGFVFGRGNQQLSARVIRRAGKENITIVSSKDKLLSLIGQSLYVDTGDEDTNEYLCGYYKVVVGYEDYVMFKMTS